MRAAGARVCPRPHRGRPQQERGGRHLGGIMGAVAPGGAVERSGAREGDRLVVTGALGASAGGLALARMRRAVRRRAVARRGRARWSRGRRAPVARVGEAQVLARAGATAMMDLSDGLSTDLSRLCAASGVGARIEESVPISDALIEAEDALRVDPQRAGAVGGRRLRAAGDLPADPVGRVGTELQRASVSPRRIGVDRESGRRRGRRGPRGALGTWGWDHLDDAERPRGRRASGQAPSVEHRRVRFRRGGRGSRPISRRSASWA